MIRVAFAGRFPARVLPYLARTGWTIHRVGSALYLHRAGVRIIAGSWEDAAPSWAVRLGRPSAGFDRRSRRRWKAAAWSRMARIAGRFAVRLPWYRWPQVPAYGPAAAIPQVPELRPRPASWYLPAWAPIWRAGGAR